MITPGLKDCAFDGWIEDLNNSIFITEGLISEENHYMSEAANAIQREIDANFLSAVDAILGVSSA